LVVIVVVVLLLLHGPVALPGIIMSVFLSPAAAHTGVPRAVILAIVVHGMAVVALVVLVAPLAIDAAVVLAT
jgi:hypothetical protein